jgi:hypothetical protein
MWRGPPTELTRRTATSQRLTPYEVAMSSRNYSKFPWVTKLIIDPPVSTKYVHYVEKVLIFLLTGPFKRSLSFLLSAVKGPTYSILILNKSIELGIT